MKTKVEITKLADEIVEMLEEYPDPSVRYEVVEELLEVTRVEEELTRMEVQKIVAVLSDRGVI